MNRLEQRIDETAPWLAARLRLLKKRMRNDFALRLMAATVKKGDIAVDVGANRGLYTLALMRAVGRNGHVIAIEPYPPNAEALSRAFGRVRRVRVVPAAASDHEGHGDLNVPVVEGTPIHALASLEGSFNGESMSPTVPLRRLDDLVGSFTHAVSFVKIDTEGHELAVLRGATALLEHDMPLLFIEIEQRHQSQPIADVFSFLQERGYVAYYVSNGLNPIESFDVAEHQLKHLPSMDGGSVPPGYVNDFVFCAARHAGDVGPFMRSAEPR